MSSIMAFYVHYGKMNIRIRLYLNDALRWINDGLYDLCWVIILDMFGQNSAIQKQTKLFQQRKNFEINSSLKHSNLTCLFHMGEGPIYRLKGADYIIGLQSFDCKTTHIIYNIAPQTMEGYILYVTSYRHYIIPYSSYKYTQ